MTKKEKIKETEENTCNCSCGEECTCGDNCTCTDECECCECHCEDCHCDEECDCEGCHDDEQLIVLNNYINELEEKILREKA